MVTELQSGTRIRSLRQARHWNVNHGDVPVTVIFCLTPPSF